MTHLATPSTPAGQAHPAGLDQLSGDGEPVGYDIQHASDHTEFVARLVLERFPQAAE